MIRLLYFSQAKPHANSALLDDILRTSRKNNATLDITGVLVHGGGMFMQVLEGPEAVVLRLYVKILDDKRHTDSRVIHITPTSTRLFPNWTMGVIEAEPLSFEEVAHLRAHRTESVDSKVFTQLMRKFNGLLLKGDPSMTTPEKTTP
ncbi:BLUF domain-containing protein [Limnobacter humi]|uniref:BLUF domain-containing protein n=1 Tax=Limnobacter humi TaxID=1778671 RepID=A0ABT1WGZ0_9BURK|nr:BLUF domain-containing protein [Limnobacter humi]MCQ8896787.1 BLUF domain-containing protein [Limnobacter humi]